MRNVRHEKYLDTQRLLAIVVDNLDHLKNGASAVELIALGATADAAENARAMVTRTVDTGLATLEFAPRLAIVR